MLKLSEIKYVATITCKNYFLDMNQQEIFHKLYQCIMESDRELFAETTEAIVSLYYSRQQTFFCFEISSTSASLHVGHAVKINKNYINCRENN